MLKDHISIKRMPYNFTDLCGTIIPNIHITLSVVVNTVHRKVAKYKTIFVFLVKYQTDCQCLKTEYVFKWTLDF